MISSNAYDGWPEQYVPNSNLSTALHEFHNRYTRDQTFTRNHLCFLSLYIVDSFPFIAPAKAEILFGSISLVSILRAVFLVCLQVLIRFHSLFFTLKPCAFLNRGGNWISQAPLNIGRLALDSAANDFTVTDKFSRLLASVHLSSIIFNFFRTWRSFRTKNRNWILMWILSYWLQAGVN